MAEKSNKPLLVMFAGPNGSGKSTITPIFQSQTDFPQNYINPDEIALTLGGNTMSKAYEASAIAAKERFKCIEEKQSFSFETVMSHPSKLAILETAKKAGFETRLVFIGTNNPLTNVDRVKQRVIEGGHNVPFDKIVSRYHRSLSLLPKASEIADKTYIFDNTDSSRLEAVLSQGKVVEKPPGETTQWVKNSIAILDERQQEKFTIEQRNPASLSASLDRGEYAGRIESVGKHFLVQQTRDGQAIIHENLILSLDEFAIGHDVLINYQNGLHDISIPELSVDTLKTIDDTLFELASSAKYVALDRDTEGINSNCQKRCSFPSGVTLEKDSQSLSILYNDKSIKFDQDFNVVQNDFSEREIRQLNQQIQSVRQQALEQSRNQRIEQDRGISL